MSLATAATTTVSTASSALEDASGLNVDLGVKGDLVHLGGPVLGLGASGRNGERAHFAAQLGYEVAAPNYLLFGLHVESDFERRAALAAVVELATPWLGSIPSIGIGPGVALEIVPEADFAVRMQASVAYPILGISAVADYYPATGTRQLALYARISI